jgi:hypothetical protein
MAEKPAFDLQAAHKHFSTACFNRAWDLIDKSDRSALEDEEMIRLGQASLFHWAQRDDCTDRNMSIGFWQLSRIYALLHRPHEARRYADFCLQHSEGEAPFYRAYAFEALARSESLKGNEDASRSFLRQARDLLEQITDQEARAILAEDLETI